MQHKQTHHVLLLCMLLTGCEVGAQTTVSSAVLSRERLSEIAKTYHSRGHADKATSLIAQEETITNQGQSSEFIAQQNTRPLRGSKSNSVRETYSHRSRVEGTHVSALLRTNGTCPPSTSVSQDATAGSNCLLRGKSQTCEEETGSSCNIQAASNQTRQPNEISPAVSEHISSSTQVVDIDQPFSSTWMNPSSSLNNPPNTTDSPESTNLIRSLLP